MPPSKKTLSAGRYLASSCCVAALALVAFAGLVSAFPERAFGPSYTMWSQAFAMTLEAHPASGDLDFEVLILGDSRAKAAYPAKELGSCVAAITAPGSSPFDLYLLARRYLEHHRMPKVVVLSVSPVHLQSREVLWQHTARFGFATPDEMAEFLDVLHRLDDDSYGSSIDLRRRLWLHRLRAPHLYLAELRQFFLLRRAGANRRLAEQLERSRGHFEFSGAPPQSGTYESEYDRFRPIPTQDAFLRRTLDLLSATDDSEATPRFHVVLLPVSESPQSLDPGYAEQVESYFRGLAEEYPTIAIDQEWRRVGLELMADPDHLNAAGAALEVTRLRSQLAGTCAADDSAVR